MDKMTLARVGREQGEASQRLAGTHGIAAWQATTALFVKTEVLRRARMTCELDPNAVELGLDAALPAGSMLEECELGRGERTHASISDVQVVRFVGRTSDMEATRSA